MTDWNSFTIFEGTCILNKNIFSTTTAFEFREWLEKLRADALHGGIPEGQVEDVVKLLNKFFPAGAQPRMIAFKQPDSPNSGIVPDPETVSYGASKISINDGPCALGYIFSIAASNAAFPRTYTNYAVPLLAIYARCLYLAYVLCEGGLPDEKGVPYMANCTYTTLAGTNPAFNLLLGSTYQTIGDLRASQIQIMNRFRRGIVDGGLGQYKPARTLPLEPRVYAGAIIAFKKYLHGLVPNRGGTTLWIPGTTTIARPSPLVDDSVAKSQFMMLAAQRAAQWLARNKTVITPLAYGKAISSQALTKARGPSITKAIDTALGQIIDKRWREGYNRAKAWTDLLPHVKEFYIQVYTPHMFLAQMPTPSKPYLAKSRLEPDLTKPQVSMPGWAIPLEAEVNTILISQKDLILDKLDHLYSWISTGAENLSDGGPDRPRYGRCAETYPVVGLLPNYIPDRVIPPAANPSPVRGFAVQVLRFNNSILPNVVTCNNLSLDFSGATLNALHAAQAKDPVYRLPCSNCETLLPAMDVPIGRSAYYADMAELYPSAVPTIN